MHESNIAKRLLVTAGACVSGHALQALIPIVSLPLFISAWDLTLYGEWLVMSTLPGFMAMSSAGFADVAANSMVMSTGAHARRETRQIYQTMFVLILALTAVLLLGWAAAALLLEPGRMGFAEIDRRSFVLLILLFVVQFSTNQVIGLFTAGFRALGHVATGIMWGNASRLVAFVAMCLPVLMGRGPVEALTANVAGLVAVTCLMQWDLARRADWLRLGMRHGSRKRFFQLLRPALAFTSLPLSNAIRNQGVVLVIAHVCGPASVVLFTAIRTLANAGTRVVSIVHRTLQTEMSAAFGAGQIGILRSLHRRAVQSAMLLSLLSVGALALFGPLVFDRWTGGKLVLDHRVFAAMLAVSVVNSCWLTHMVVITSVNRHERAAITYALCTAAGAALGYVFAIWLGLLGAVLALLAADVAMIMAIGPASMQITQDRFPLFLASQITFPRGMIRMLRL